MADVTISSLPLGTPSGSALLPYSTGSNTQSVSVSGIFQNTNSVGIGGIPGQALDVVGNIRLGQPSISNYDNKLQFWNSNYANEVASIQANGNYNLLFNTRDASGVLAERMRINNVGDVGIGTASPTAKLDVNGDVAGTNIVKAYAIFEGNNAINTACTVLKSYNISGIVKQTYVGQYKVTFTNPVTWPYVPVVGAFNNNSGDGMWNAAGYRGTNPGVASAEDPTNNGFQINCYTSSTWQSQRYVSFVVY